MEICPTIQVVGYCPILQRRLQKHIRGAAEVNRKKIDKAEEQLTGDQKALRPDSDRCRLPRVAGCVLALRQWPSRSIAPWIPGAEAASRLERSTTPPSVRLARVGEWIQCSPRGQEPTRVIESFVDRTAQQGTQIEARPCKLTQEPDTSKYAFSSKKK